MGVFFVTDNIQHNLYNYFDVDHSDYEPGKNYIEKFYSHFDKRLSQLYKKNLNLIIVSDHGFGKVETCFSLTKWLIKEKYLVLKNKKKAKYLNIKNIKIVLKKLRLYNLIFKIMPRKYLNKIYKNLEIDERLIKFKNLSIDWKKTICFPSFENTCLGQIYFNDKRFQDGKLSEKDIERYTEEIRCKLKKFVKKNRHTIKIFKKQDLYGKKPKKIAPDISFVIDNFACEISNMYTDEKRIFYNWKESDANHPGTHRQEGVFLAYGPDIKKNIKIDSVNIYDIAPTILHMYELLIPEEMDGRVLTEIFKSNSRLRKSKVKYKKENKVKKILNEIKI